MHCLVCGSTKVKAEYADFYYRSMYPVKTVITDIKCFDYKRHENVRKGMKR